MTSKNYFRLPFRAQQGWLMLLALACSLAGRTGFAQAPPYPLPDYPALDGQPAPAVTGRVPVPLTPVWTLNTPAPAPGSPARRPRLLDVRPAGAEGSAVPIQPVSMTSSAAPIVPSQPPELQVPQAQPMPLPTQPSPPWPAKEDGAAVGSDLSLNASWRDGLFLESPNKDFSIHFGGLLHYDLAFYTADARVQSGPGGVGSLRDGTALRRRRLGADGTMWEVIKFKAEFEFANDARADDQVFGSPFPTDVYLTFTQLPVVGNIRIGNQKEVLSLEHLTPDRYLEFLERSPSFDAFIPSTFIPGITVFDAIANERMTWAAGIYKNTKTPYGFGVGDGQYSATGRLTGLPLWAEDGAVLWHVGGAYSHRDLADGTARFRVRDSVRGAPVPLLNTLADTGSFRGDSQDLLILESAMVLGPLSIQAEYAASTVNNGSVGGGATADVFYQGYYVEALLFLTGEHRNYNSQRGAFDRVYPYENFFLVRGEGGRHFGSGAWELGIRFSSVDLTDKGIQGGVLQDLTVGLNWYLNPNAKIQWNYDLTHRSATGTNSDGTIQGFGVRMAFDF